MLYLSDPFFLISEKFKYRGDILVIVSVIFVVTIILVAMVTWDNDKASDSNTRLIATHLLILIMTSCVSCILFFKVSTDRFVMCRLQHGLLKFINLDC